MRTDVRRWNEPEEMDLRSRWERGESSADIALSLKRTHGSVVWKLRGLGLPVPELSPINEPTELDTDARNQRQDAAFQRALIRAIEAGLEQVRPGTIVDHTPFNPTHFQPAMRGSGGSSSMQLCVEEGMANGTRGAHAWGLGT